MSRKTSILTRSRDAENVIARQGISAWLVFICAFVMSLLAIYTITLGGVASQVSKRWEQNIQSSASLRIPDTVQNESAASIAENLLKTSPGVIGYALIDKDRQIQLLAPWLGDNIPPDLLSLPRIYSVEIEPARFNEESLLLRLEAELPGAIWDNHQRWRGPLLDTARRIRTLSFASTALIAFAFLALIFISAQASIAANAKSILLLRQVGADDSWITNGFLRKFVMRSLSGAMVGVSIGVFASWSLLSGDIQSSQIFDNLSFSRLQIPRALIVILFAGLFGYFATRIACARYLGRIR